MSLDTVVDLARQGRLYPSVILYGASFEERQSAAVELCRTLFCTKRKPAARPCGKCRHCRRVAWPEAKAERFHPDFHVLERDLRSATSVEATKQFIRTTVATPFEARGQVFVLAEADSLSPGATDALLKTLEEPPGTTPRHFLLLAGSKVDLLPTLRSRSLAVYLGSTESLDKELISDVAEQLALSLDAYFTSRSPVLLLTAAGTLGGVPGWDDVRAKRPWATAAAAVLHYIRSFDGPVAERRALYALASDLVDGWTLRLRAITSERILDGLLSRHLGAIPPRLSPG